MFKNTGNYVQANNSRWEECEDVLKYLRGQNADTSVEAAEIRVILPFLFELSILFISP